jgi:hypothetical protein
MAMNNGSGYSFWLLDVSGNWKRKAVARSVEDLVYLMDKYDGQRWQVIDEFDGVVVERSPQKLP